MMNFKVQRSRAHERITVALDHVNADISISFKLVADFVS